MKVRVGLECPAAASDEEHIARERRWLGLALQFRLGLGLGVGVGLGLGLANPYPKPNLNPNPNQGGLPGRFVEVEDFGHKVFQAAGCGRRAG